MDSAFLPSDRWGRNITSYTSDTKRREQATNVLSLGAVGCVAMVSLAVAYAWLFPTVGKPLVASAAKMADEMQGLREQNALLRAHLRRLAQAQELLLQNQATTNSNQSHVEAHSSLRRLLSETTGLLEEPLQPAVAEERNVNIATPTRMPDGQATGGPQQTAKDTLNMQPQSAASFSSWLLPQALMVMKTGREMKEGIQTLLYHVYRHLVFGREGEVGKRPRHHHRLATRRSGSGNAWRKRQQKQAQRTLKRLKTTRAAKRNLKRARPRKRRTRKRL